MDDNQAVLAANNIPILDKDRLQFFIKQMYKSKNFVHEQYVTWEKRLTPAKTWARDKDYFQELTNDIDEYKANIRGTEKCTRFESTANAEKGDDNLCQYFNSLAEVATADKEYIQQTILTNSSRVTLAMPRFSQ